MKTVKLRNILLATSLGICLVLLSSYVLQPLFTKKKLELKTATLINSTKPLAANFNLTDTNGKDFTFKSFRGKWTLLFFGYADCPSICPATLVTVNDVWQKFNDKNLPAQFIFASLNAKTDNKEKLKNFLHRFNPKFTGVTGSKMEINNLSKQLNIFANNELSETGEEIIDHTASLILIDPKGQLKAIISPPMQANDIAEDLVALTSKG